MERTRWSTIHWKRFAISTLFVAAFLSANCFSVNVHIHFPAARVRQAAAEIERDVRTLPQEGKEEGKTDQSNAGGLKQDGLPPYRRAAFLKARWFVVGVSISFAMPEAHAEEIDLRISTPAIDKIKASRKARYPKVFALMEKGAAGETYEGFLATRKEGLKKLSFKERRQAEKIVKAENKDRKALYKELARANSIDKETIPEIGRIFALEIIKNHCKPEHWFRNKEGKWLKVKEIGKGR